jgi:hypothetical protein
LPVWPDRCFWKLLKGARLVAYYPEGVPLFTSPDWRVLDSGGGSTALTPSPLGFTGETLSGR